MKSKLKIPLRWILFLFLLCLEPLDHARMQKISMQRSLSQRTVTTQCYTTTENVS